MSPFNRRLLATANSGPQDGLLAFQANALKSGLNPNSIYGHPCYTEFAIDDLYALGGEPSRSDL